MLEVPERPYSPNQKGPKPFSLKSSRKRSGPLGLFILLLAGLVIQYSGTYSDYSSIDNCPVKKSNSFKKNDFETWLQCTRSTLTNHCVPRTDSGYKESTQAWCFPAGELGYRDWDPISNQRPFVVSTPQCRHYFRPDTIYLCNRKGDLWLNKLQRNKNNMWLAYHNFDKSVHAEEEEDGVTYANRGGGGGSQVSAVRQSRDCSSTKLSDFFPTMYELRRKRDVMLFQDVLLEKHRDPYARDDLYIYKWAEDGFQGKGMTIKGIEESLKYLSEYPFRRPIVAQEYNKDPFLFNGKKFNLRTWAVILNSDPLMVTFHHGFVPVSIVNYYDPPPGMEKVANVPNAWRQFIPAENVTREMMDAAKTDFYSLNEHMNASPENRKIQHKNGTYGYLPKDWIFNEGTDELMRAMTYTLKATMGDAADDLVSFKGMSSSKDGKTSDINASGWYDSSSVSFICYDFIIDKSGRIWMHEENHGCGLAYSYYTKDDLPDWVYTMFESLQVQSLRLAEEIFYRKKQGLPYGFKDLITPLKGHRVLVDHSSQQQIPRQLRTFCDDM